MTLEEIGRRLREARERKGLTLHDVQVATKIRRKYLEALERGDDSELPPEVYTRGFIRAYASLVDLDGMELAQAYSRWKESLEGAWREGGEGTPADSGPEAGAGRPAAPREPDREGDGVAARPAPEAASRRHQPAASGAGAPGWPPGVPPAGARLEPPEAARGRGGAAASGRRPAARQPEPWTSPPLVGPLPGRRRDRRAAGPVTGPPARRGRPWGLWAAAVAGLVVLAGVVLYVAGSPPAPSPTGQPPAGSGLPGEAAGGQPPAPGPEGGGAAAPGGAGSEPQPPAEEPQAPAEPQVTMRRDGDDVYYTIAPAAAPAAPGAGGIAEPGGRPALAVTLEATARVWVRVRDAAGRVVFERLMQAGDRQQLDLGGGLTIRAGYPRGLALRIGETELDVPDEESPLNLHLEPSAAGAGQP